VYASIKSDANQQAQANKRASVVKLTSDRLKRQASRRDNMARDHSEYIDDYCRDNYGHSNWGYLDTYTKEELKKADHDIENNIVFWHEDDEEEEGDE
jgi:hypothetical protein